jgi:acetyl-CoA synthetase
MSNKQNIASIMTADRVFQPPARASEGAYFSSMDEYKKEYEKSINDPESYWAEKAEELDWIKKWDTVRSYDFKEAVIEWFKGGRLNVSANCLDRHLKNGRKDKIALIWEGDSEGESKTFTYEELHREVNRFALVLKANGVMKGDGVAIYLPMIPELPIAMLACARIGAMHSIVFGGFSADSLRNRIEDSKPQTLITADGGYRGGKVVPLKEISDEAVAGTSIKKVIVVERTGEDVPMEEGRDVWYPEEMSKHPDDAYCEPEAMDAEDPLFILYTSGSTGKPKGVLHTSGGYLLYAMKTFQYIFDYREEDVYWCTADIGWVTGHSYIVYGPLAAGATSVMFEGVPTYPDAGRFWRVVDKYKVTIFYTAPTAIRALAREGAEHPAKCDLSSLRVLGSVGEPINPEAWLWYYREVGREKCPIVDTWWQTETGGILIAPLPGATPLKPGSATYPFFGVEPEVIKPDGAKAAVNERGYLVIKKPWPGMMRDVYGHHERFKETHFSQYPGKYFTGDSARVDEDGYFWLMGRVDDVINVSGHRIGTAEVQNALMSHDKVAEAAVVGMPHDIKGQGLYAYVILHVGIKHDEALDKELRAHVGKEIGPIAKPDVIHFTPALPKTRSGKIMHRILRKIAEGSYDELGDTSTLADPNVVKDLIPRWCDRAPESG